jgi:agmatine deiminase
MPGEWSRHAATWIAWPHEHSDWPGRFAKIPAVYVEIVRELARGERVEIVVPPGPSEHQVRHLLEHGDVPLGSVRLHPWPTDRSWVRDSGPTCVLRRPTAGHGPPVGWVRWQFNAWAKYENWHRDAELGERIVEVATGPSWAPRHANRRIVLEGGAIDANGEGLLLTTEECLLSHEQARNPGLTREGYEQLFREHLGTDRVLWLAAGIAGDDTHGHIDDAARFVAPSVIMAATEPDGDDPNHAVLAENRRRLDRLVGTAREGTRVVELPMPRPIFHEEQRLPASYANFYIANASVIVPTFDDPADAEAIARLRAEFPHRRVVGIGCRDLVLGLGTLHCLTQPQFAAPEPTPDGAARSPTQLP